MNQPPPFKKRAPVTTPVQEPKVRPPRSEVRTAVSMPGKTLTSRLIKPLPRAVVLVCLLVGLARADTITVGAPQGGAGACPFPGCRSGAVASGWVDVSQAPYNAPDTGAADATGAIQLAVDSGAAVVSFPPGTYAICNLMPRAANQKWVGAGIGQTFLVGTPGCANLLVTTAGTIAGGPVQQWSVEGITFQGAVTVEIVAQCRELERITIRNNAFDTGGVGCPPNASGPAAIQVLGCRDFLIEDNEFYSSCPGSGGRGILASGIRGGTIRRNTSNWQKTFIEMSTTLNQPSELTTLEANVYHGTFWGIPTKFTNSGATVTYGANTLTDTAASFAGLCDAGGASPCAAAAGSFVRALTAKVTGTTATFNTAGGFLTDAGQDFVGGSVRRGDIIKTTPVCFGNGSKGQTARAICTGGAGASAWGDSCVCTATADCASGVCEPRWATVDTVGDLHNLQVDEWVRETACPLGAAVCPTSSRRPASAPRTSAGLAYTIFGWTGCQVNTYTGTVVTCNSNGWFAWNGTASAPANGTLYEVSWPRPLYNMLLGNSNAPGAVQGLRIANNLAVGGFADLFEIFATQSVVIGNHSRDGSDTCVVVSGDKNTVVGNLSDHCGARGILLQANDSTATANVAWDTPWININATVLGDLAVTGSRNTFTGNKVVGGVVSTVQNRYGIVSYGTSDSNLFVGNTCGGTYTAGCYRFDSAASTNNRIQGYHGETISNNAGTFALEGGTATQAQLTAAAAQNGSTLGCSDCTVAAPTASGGTGAVAIRAGGQWNGR